MPTVTDYQENSNAYPLQWIARARSPMAGSILLDTGAEYFIGTYDLWSPFFGGYPVWANLATTTTTPVCSVAFASVFSGLIYAEGGAVLVDVKVRMPIEISIFTVRPTVPITTLFSLTTGKLLSQYVSVYFQRAAAVDTNVYFHFQMAEE